MPMKENGALGNNENTDKYFTLYDYALYDFTSDCNVVRQLNKLLRQTIKELFEEKRVEFEKLKESLTTKQREDLSSLIKIFEALGNDKERKREIIEFSISDEDVIIMAQNFLDTRGFELEFNRFVRGMSLVYLIASFKKFIELTLETTYKICPDALKSSKNFTFEELIDFKSIEDLRDAMIEKELKNIINEDIDVIAGHMSNNFKFNMRMNEDWERLRERFYRRNIIIHNKSYPSPKYRYKTGYSGKEVPLPISENYLKTSLKLVESLANEIYSHFKKKYKGQKLVPIPLAENSQMK